MTTETRHLTIEELLSAAGGQSLDREARAHLETCAICRTEVDEWALIAGGVRDFMAGVEPQPWSPPPRLLETHTGWRERVLDSLRASIAKRRVVAALTAAALVAAGVSYGMVALSGGAHAPGSRVTSPSGSAQRVLLLSVQKMTSQSFDAAITFQDTTSYGPYGKAPTSFTLHITVQYESAEREKTIVSGSIAGTLVHEVVITYDGTTYVSTDGGITFQAERLSSASPYGIQTVLEMLQSLGSVTDQGSGRADGVAVEKYHAILDPSKLRSAIRSQLQSLGSSLSTQAQNILSAVTITGGTADATVDSSGRLVTMALAMTFAVDGPKLGLSGNPTVQETWSARVFNYGADIVVQPPSAS